MRRDEREPIPYFGSDLLRAERYEREIEESQRWSAKLHELAEDDLTTKSNAAAFGQDDDAAWQAEIDMMQRTRPSSPTSHSSHNVRVNRMTEQEHAAYIRDGMHRRKHGERMMHRRDRRSGDRSKVERLAADDLRRRAREEERAAQKTVELVASRKKWEIATLTADPEKTYFWPLAHRVRVDQVPSKADEENVQYFLLAHSSEEESANRLRKALLRYHPDRFLASNDLKSIPPSTYRDNVIEAVTHLAQVLTHITTNRRL